jgi:hypothetical protein
MRPILLLLSLVLTGLGACSLRSVSESDFYRWLNDPDHGLVQTRKVNHLQVTVKYLPAELLAYQEWKRLPGAGPSDMDSLLRLYGHSHAFLLTLKSDKEGSAVKSREPEDVLYRGVDSYQAYQQRIRQMNFGMEGCVELRTKQGIFKPVLHTLENTYGVVGHRSIYLVFTEERGQNGPFSGQRLDFTFKDDFFDTGIHHFLFEPNQLQQVPTILSAHD